jgi:hypothetical protein
MVRSFLEVSKPLTRVDTEHGFGANLKAIPTRIVLFFGRREGGASVEAEDAGSEDGGYLAEHLGRRRLACRIKRHCPLPDWFSC